MSATIWLIFAFLGGGCFGFIAGMEWMLRGMTKP